MLSCLAWAGEGFDAHGFHLTGVEPDLRAPLTVSRVGLGPKHGLAAVAVFEYASAPLVRFVSDGETVTETPVLDNIFGLNLGLGVTPLRWLRIDAALPLFLSSTGLEGEAQGFALGDARFAALVSVLRPDPEAPVGFGVAVRPWIDVPTGASDLWLGQDGVAGGGVVAGSMDVGALSVALDAGLQFNPEAELANLANSDQVLLGGALGLQLGDHVGLTLESRTAVALAANAVPGADSPSELMLFGRYVHDSGGHGLAGVSLGLDDAAGAAAFRLFLGGGFGTRPVAAPPPDTDGDGIVDASDACPAEAETVNLWRDDDGCPDRLARIDVRAKWGDRDAPEAQVELIDEGGGLRSAAAGRTSAKDVMPGTSWKATATARCAEGEATLTAAEGDNSLVVQLRPQRDAEVMVKVVDTKGRPVPEARVTWGEGMGVCADPVLPLPTGSGLARVGAGEHEIFVTADGWTTWHAALSLDDGQSVTVEARLDRSKVQLTETQVVILDKVYFKTGKADIDPRSFGLLDDVAQTIRRAHIQSLEVAGHTDDVGSDASNQTLSQARADAVRDHLVKQGVDPKRLTAVGYGESRPVASGKSNDARAKNRRVEFTILKGPAPQP